MILQEYLVQNPKQGKELANEIKLHKFLHSHKHICKYHRQFSDKLFVHILLEDCEHGSLKDALKKRKTMAEFEVKYYSKQLVQVLFFFRLFKVVHRDFNISNILLDSNMQIKVSDFGSAVKLETVT